MKLRDGGVTIMAALALYWIVKDVFVEPPVVQDKCAKAVVLDGATHTDWKTEYCGVFEDDQHSKTDGQ